MLTIAVILVSLLVALASCNKNYTVTSEVILTVEVRNYDGQGNDLNGQVAIGLFCDTVPVACLNFQKICEGISTSDLPKLSLKNTNCHRIIKDLIIQCGDLLNQGGTFSRSIYGETFNDENFIISHSSGGIVSMANKGRDTNGSQFFFTLGRSRFFDNKHVAFGKVVRGYQYLVAINRIGSEKDSTNPKRTIRITDCEVKEVKNYELSEEDMRTDDLEGIVNL